MAGAATAAPTNKNSAFVFAGKVHTDFIYQDEQCVVFEEALEDKAAPNHFLVVPRKVIPRLSDASPEDEKILGHLLVTAKRTALELGLAGYHVTVDECHRSRRFLCLHVFGRALNHMLWPVGPGSRL